MLDAGTGAHSLGWLLGLSTEAVVAVTGGQARERSLRTAFAGQLRPVDRVMTGNWQDGALLDGEGFDTVVADYLLGALDGWAPYFQDQLLGRLAPLCRGRLYIVGLEPYPRTPSSDVGRFVRRMAALRDACILLAGHQCYREYPRAWVRRNLAAGGWRVVHSESFPISYGARFVDGQLDVCMRKLPHIAPALVDGLRRHIDAMREEGHALLEEQGVLRFGEDYVIAAERA